MAEKKIISISKEELLFLRKAILKTFDRAIDSPGDKSGYESLANDITERLSVEPQQQKHSVGLLHKLMHDEGHNRDFLDACYRYISGNEYDREQYLKQNTLVETDNAPLLEAPKTKDVEVWKQRFTVSLALLGMVGIAILFYFFQRYMAAKQQQVNWNMTTAWSENSTIQTFFLEKFVKEVEKQTNGRLVIHIFPDFQFPNSNGHHKTKDEVRKALSAGEVDILHSGPYTDFDETPEALLFSTLPFGKNYQEMVAWVRQSNIKNTLENLYKKEGIVTFSAGHTGPQYGGWYREMPSDTNFFSKKTVRFAGFAGYLLNHNNVGARNKPMFQYQYASLMEQIRYDALEWLNPEEDIKMSLHLKGFRYYDRSHWNEPNSMFLFYINQDAINSLHEELKLQLLSVIQKMSEERIFKTDSESHQLAENTIENTLVPSCNCNIKIFDMQQDCPETYNFLKRQNRQLLDAFFMKNPQLKTLYEDYQSMPQSQN